MKNTIFYILFCVILFSGTQSVIADMINFDYVIAADGTLTTPYNWAIVDTFDSARPGWIYYGGAIVSGSLSGSYEAPYLDTTQYFTVNSLSEQTGNSAIVIFGGAAYNYLGLYWGSINTYNKIQLLNSGNIIASYLATDIMSMIDDEETISPSDRYINIYLDSDFDGIRFSSTLPAFEIDNLAVGVHAPVPGAILLGFIGLCIAGWKLRNYA